MLALKSCLPTKSGGQENEANILGSRTNMARSMPRESKSPQVASAKAPHRC